MIDGWFFTLEEEVMAASDVPATDAHGLLERTNTKPGQEIVYISAD